MTPVRCTKEHAEYFPLCVTRQVQGKLLMIGNLKHSMEIKCLNDGTNNTLYYLGLAKHKQVQSYARRIAENCDDMGPVTKKEFLRAISYHLGLSIQIER